MIEYVIFYLSARWLLIFLSEEEERKQKSQFDDIM